MYEWSDLRYFLAVHREGTLIGAAGELRVDPTTVGRSVAALEDQLRARLFVRGPRGWVVTPAGRQVVAAAERAEEAAHDVERIASGASQRPAGRVRLTTIEVLASHVVAPALPELHERHPDIRLDIWCTPITMDLTRGEADIAVRIGRPTEPGLVARRLKTVRSSPYASRSWLDRRGLTEGITDLDGLEVLLLLAPQRWTDDLGAVRPAMRSTELSVVLEACVSGLGVALLPDLLAAEHADLVALDGLGCRTDDPIWLTMHRDLSDVARVRAVADFLVEVTARR